MNGRAIPGEYVQSTLDRFLTNSPLAKRRRPATEEEETYLE